MPTTQPNHIAKLLQANRSFRRFNEAEQIPLELAQSWIENLRFTASMRNAQPLKYVIIANYSLEAIYPHLRWAGYLKDWDGPAVGERPPLLILQLLDSELSTTSRFDEGIHLAALTLQACEMGYGCCIIAAFNAKEITSLLQIPERYKPLCVVAIGRPKEKVEIVPLKENQIAYYRTEDGTHCVPKRSGSDLLLS